MAEAIKVWYDKEGDYLEVLFERKAGYFKETENDSVCTIIFLGREERNDL